ncbi:TniQ family protein [Gymnodinialimonas sp.]
MRGPLPIRTTLARLETPASYVSRLACENGLSGAHEFCVDQDLDMQGIADGNPWMLQKLGHLGGLTSDEIFRWSIEKLKNTQYRIANQLIERRWIVRTSLRLCPCCVAQTMHPDDEGIVGQATWHIPFMRQCPQHGVLLRSFERVGYAGSVHDFTKRCLEQRWDIMRAAEDATVSAPSGLSSYIEARAMGAPLPRWIDALECNAAAYFCELLGLLVDRGADVGISALTNDERRQVGDIGYRITSGGTKDVVEALRELPRPRVKSKAQAHLGSLYQWLSRSALDVQYDPLKDLIRDYIVETFPVGPGETVFGQIVEQRRVHNLSTFARDCRVSTKRSRQALVAAGFLRSSIATSDNPISQVFCAQASQPVLDKLNGGITRRMAIKQLNIPRAQFDALLSGRILQPMPGLGEITPYYARSDVILLLEKLTQERCIGDLPTYLVDIQTACRKLVCGAAEIVELIVRNQLDVIAQEKRAEGYLAVRLSVSELAGKLAGVGVEGYTKAKLKQLLSINDPAVKFLIEAGYLSATASRNPVTRKAAAVVLPNDYALFLDQFIPAKRLAEMHGTTPRSVMARMRKLGIAPLGMPEGCVGTIYETRKLLPDMLA